MPNENYSYESLHKTVFSPAFPLLGLRLRPVGTVFTPTRKYKPALALASPPRDGCAHPAFSAPVQHLPQPRIDEREKA